MAATAAHKLLAVDSKLADTANPEAALPSSRAATVFGKERQLHSPPFSTPPGVEQNAPYTMDELKLLGKLPDACIPLVFFDPRYRGVLDYQDYGHEGKTRGRERAQLRQIGPG